MDDMPRCDLLELSPDARNDDRIEPVCGQINVTAPPPPPGVNDAVGFEVVTHKACFLRTIVEQKFRFSCRSRKSSDKCLP